MMLSKTCPPLEHLETSHDSESSVASSAASLDSFDVSICHFYEPPEGVDYDGNRTVFGKILRGESPARVLDETENVLAFFDIHPHASLHGLVIPKKLVKSVFDLQVKDLPLLREMKESAMNILKREQPFSYETGDYNLCFHVPPFNSVDHLHLHVLAPMSGMRIWDRIYNYNTWTRWVTSLDMVISRLENGLSSVPYRKPKDYALL